MKRVMACGARRSRRGKAPPHARDARHRSGGHRHKKKDGGSMLDGHVRFRATEMPIDPQPFVSEIGVAGRPRAEFPAAPAKLLTMVSRASPASAGRPSSDTSW